MFNPQMTSSQMELLPLVCLCLLSWSGTTSADQHETVVVKQDDDVILPCSIGYNIKTGTFDWKKDGDQKEVFLYAAGSHYNNGRDGQAEQFKGRVSHFEDELKHGNASIKIKRTKMTDSGNYTCKFPNNHPSPTFHIELVVEPVLKDRTGENITGAAPKPSITTVNDSKYWSLLKCEANGIPELEVTWKDSDGNILAEDRKVSGSDRVYITLLTNVTKTGIFHCVATQKKISHTISAETSVYIDEDKPQTPQISQSDHTGWIFAGVFIALVVVGVLLAVLRAKGYIILNFKKDEKQPEEKPMNQQNSEKQPDPEV